MSYVDAMKSTAQSAFDELFVGIERVVVTDFPDHRNVGDSAIALGQLHYFERSRISVDRVQCIGTLSKATLRSLTPVVINGGGNIAGFFDGIDKHRNRIASALPQETVLIQAPQSIHFGSTKAREAFFAEFASRPGLRMSVRDNAAFKMMEGSGIEVILAPDAVHHLGKIVAPDPTQPTVVLARRDQEAASGSTEQASGIDWPLDARALRISTWLRWKVRYLGKPGQVLNPSPDAWRRIARSRFDRGVDQLATGETVVTDRLHAMLISLQMGRRVIAVDNNNRKLSKYADTWFGASQPDVTFAKDISAALKMAG